MKESDSAAQSVPVSTEAREEQSRPAEIYSYFPPSVRKILKKEYMTKFITGPSNFLNRLSSPAISQAELDFFEEWSAKHGGPLKPNL